MVPLLSSVHKPLTHPNSGVRLGFYIHMNNCVSLCISPRSEPTPKCSIVRGKCAHRHTL